MVVHPGRSNTRTHFLHDRPCARPSPGYHGSSGELPVDYPNTRTLLSKTFLEAGKELGYDYVDYNGPTQAGNCNFLYCSNCKVNCLNLYIISSSLNKRRAWPTVFPLLLYSFFGLLGRLIQQPHWVRNNNKMLGDYVHSKAKCA